MHVSLVKRMHEALRGKAMGADAQLRAVSELYARIQRLRDRDARLTCVRLSRDVEVLGPAAMSA
jgi:hypothetical protein